MENKFDVIIIGGGPNGLTAGAYLSKAGLKVLVMERRYEMGGGANIEEVTLAGYFHNTHAIYMMMVDYAPPYKDLKLEEDYGLKHIYPPLQFAMLFKDGSHICIYNDLERTCRSFAKFSAKDADTYRELYRKFAGWMDDFLAPYTYVQPKPTLELAAAMEEIEMGQEMFGITDKTPKELVDEWFEDEHVKSLMLNTICFWGLDPQQSGLGYLIPLYFNRSAHYRIVSRGSHVLPQVLIKVILENGGKLLTIQEPSKIIVENGEAKGIVRKHDGKVFEARAIISTIDTHQTFLKLVGEENLDKEFAEGLKLWMWEHWSYLATHCALLDAPKFKVAEGDPELNEALIYILGCETAEDYIAHQQAIGRGEVDDNPIVSCTFPTIHDPTQTVRPGTHTAIIQQQAPYELKDGGAEKWSSLKFKRDRAAKMLGRVREYAPNFTDDIIRQTYISTPLDIEKKYRDMVRGSIKQGQYHPLQMGYVRPNVECSRHRSPIKGLYLGGACTYPGGTILLANGYLAAEAVVEDLGVDKWWPEPEMVKKAREKGIPGF